MEGSGAIGGLMFSFQRSVWEEPFSEVELEKLQVCLGKVAMKAL